MTTRELIVSGPAGDPRVEEQVRAVRADPDGAAERELEIRERDSECFRVELTAKDGTVKARWEDHVTVAELWARIDAMPVRRRELRERAAARDARSAPV